MLKIAIASGKGGTGKTTIAALMAMSLARHDLEVSYLDCDVEEPNGHILLKPDISEKCAVTVPIPEVDLDKCTFCGICAEICQYNAIAVLNDKVMVFSSLCHSCGGCVNICPERAITEIPRPIGQIRDGVCDTIKFREGCLDVGEAQAPPVTRELKRKIPDAEVAIIDAPPGTSCPVIEAVSNTDYVILVTEPTPFGMHDLELSVEMLRLLKIPFGVIINRSDIGNEVTENYCRTEDIKILAKIPFVRKIAEAYSEGNLVSLLDTPLPDELYTIYESIAGQVPHV